MVNTKGATYTESGFYGAFRKIREKLFKAGKVGRGLTFHGLRHTVATKLADAGASTRVGMMHPSQNCSMTRKSTLGIRVRWWPGI